MTSWPWMQGVSVAIADPIPVDEGDDRPSVKDLLQEHRKHIDEVKKELMNVPEFEAETKHDDLWILRFVLSHKKKTQAAVKAAKYTLRFRKQHKLDERDIRFSPPGPDALCDAMHRYAVYADDDTYSWTLPDEKRGVITFIRYAGFDQHGAVKNVKEEDWLPSFMYCSEWAHQWLDRTTRITGRLTKNVRLVDLKGMKLLDFSPANSRRDGRVMDKMEDCYPQLLKAIYIVNPPTWISAVWEMARPLVPKRVTEKFDIIRPAKNEKDRQLLLKVIDKHNLPARFGGDNEVWPANFPLPE